MSGHPRRRRRRADPLAAADVLRRFRRAAGAPGPGPAGVAATAWPSVVGDAAAAHSAPVRRTRAGVLTIACSSAAWAHELTMRREELTARLVAECPEAGVVGLRFAVADHVPSAGRPTPAPGPSDRPPAPVPTPGERAAASRAAEGVDDPRVRDLVARAAAAAAARRRGASDT